MAILSYSQKFLYRLLSSDYNRHAVLLDVLQESSDMDTIVIFGDSRSMFGIDAQFIRDSLNFSGEIYNLSSLGQELYESSYFYSLIKANTKVVIQCTSPAFFSDNRDHVLPEVRAISMFLSGYRISEETKQLLPNYTSFFDRPTWLNYFHSRSYYRSYFHNLIRPLFDNEVFDEKARFSKYFPHIYTQDKHPNYPVYTSDCSVFLSKETPQTQLDFLAKTRSFFQEKEILYILVLMPINPDQCDQYYDLFHEYAELIASESGVLVINISDLLRDNYYFYDSSHPNKKGAEVISQEIAKQLQQIIP
jgi:hypothetical protein